MKILISNAHVLHPDGSVREGNIAVEGNKIAAVGEIPASWQPERTIDATDRLAVPGFVNAQLRHLQRLVVLQCQLPATVEREGAVVCGRGGAAR